MGTADQKERGTATRQPIIQICSPDVVELVRSNLALDFPLGEGPSGAFSVIVKTDGSFAPLSHHHLLTSSTLHCSGNGDLMHLPVSQSQEMFNFLQTSQLNIHLTCCLSITLTAVLLVAWCRLAQY